LAVSFFFVALTGKRLILIIYPQPS
jgi:hypothetical protein